MVEGEIVTGSYDNKETGKRYIRQSFCRPYRVCRCKKCRRKMPEPMEGDGFLNIPESMEEEMPFR